jgi:hypothetical protein
VGDEIMVMVTEIDNLGRINLSRRAVLEGANPAEEEEELPGEIPSPLTRRASMLTPTRALPLPRQGARQDGRGGGQAGGYRGGRRRGGGRGGGTGGQRRGGPPPMR